MHITPSLRRSWSLSLWPRPIAAMLLVILTMALGLERAGSQSTKHLETSAEPPNWNPELLDTKENRNLDNEQPRKAYGQLPLAFEANYGQSDKEVRFIARGSGYGLFLTANQAVLALRDPAKHDEDAKGGALAKTGSVPTKETVLRLKLVGALSTQVTGVNELPGKANYFIGNDPAKWRTDIPTYASVKYQGVYPGVDMVYHGNQNQLEYDFLVDPGSDPSLIRFRIEGSKAMRLNPQGDLVCGVDGINVVLRKPDIYQESNNARHAIQGGYTLLGPHQVGFQVGDYDTTRPLVIDPVLVYSTFLGGNQADVGNGIAVDSTGNAYVTGSTVSTNFPTLNPFQGSFGGGASDVFVAKLNPAGNALVYSTFLGFGSGNAIAVDGAGNAYITGETSSASFPTMNPFQASYGGGTQDAFVTKLSAAGNALIYSTYLGVISYDAGNGIAVDSAGNAYVTGYTYFNTFPKVNPAQPTFGGAADAFVVKFNPAGNALVYSTFLGGSNYEYGQGIALDGAGNAYVTGWTASTNFPTVGPAQATNGGGGMDVFVAKLNALGTAFAYATYLGGSGEDLPYSIAVDGAGNAYVTGYTKSTNFPTANAAQASYGGGVTDAFVTKLNAAGNVFAYSTYLGGSGEDVGRGIAVDGVGSAYLSGYTKSTNFPTLLPLQATFGGGDYDAFTAKLDPPGTLTFSTYLGGAFMDQSNRIAVDGAGSIYLTGRTSSPNYPSVNPYQATYGSGFSDAFVTKISIPPPCVDPPNTTMVAWYPFDETVGTTAANLATGNIGTLINSPTHIPGKVAGALRLDGVNDHVDSPSTIVTNIGPAGLPQTCSGSYSTCRGDFSIDTWIKVDPTASVSAITVTDKRSGTVPAIHGYLFFVYQRNSLGLQLADGTGTSGYSNYLSPVIPGLAGSWHHVGVTVSRRSALGIKWYVDGAVIGSSDPTVGTTRYGSLVNNSPLRIGADSWLGAWFKGDIDELEIFNRELTSAEVMGIFNAQASGKCK